MDHRNPDLSTFEVFVDLVCGVFGRGKEKYLFQMLVLYKFGDQLGFSFFVYFIGFVYNEINNVSSLAYFYNSRIM